MFRTTVADVSHRPAWRAWRDGCARPSVRAMVRRPSEDSRTRRRRRSGGDGLHCPRVRQVTGMSQCRRLWSAASQQWLAVERCMHAGRLLASLPISTLATQAWWHRLAAMSEPSKLEITRRCIALRIGRNIWRPELVQGCLDTHCMSTIHGRHMCGHVHRQGISRGRQLAIPRSPPQKKTVCRTGPPGAADARSRAVVMIAASWLV